jgi:hypothetical protein
MDGARWCSRVPIPYTEGTIIGGGTFQFAGAGTLGGASGSTAVLGTRTGLLGAASSFVRLRWPKVHCALRRNVTFPPSYAYGADVVAAVHPGPALD